MNGNLDLETNDSLHSFVLSLYTKELNLFGEKISTSKLTHEKEMNIGKWNLLDKNVDTALAEMHKIKTYQYIRLFSVVCERFWEKKKDPVLLAV